MAESHFCNRTCFVVPPTKIGVVKDETSYRLEPVTSKIGYKMAINGGVSRRTSVHLSMAKPPIFVGVCFVILSSRKYGCG